MVLEHLVQIFFVSAILLGAMLKLQPQFFDAVAVPGQVINTPTSNTVESSVDTCSCPHLSTATTGLESLFTDNVSLPCHSHFFTVVTVV